MWQEESSETEIADINIIPFVDIVLVLLILFMLSASLFIPYSMDIKLPTVNAQPLEKEVEPIRLTINAQEEILWQETIIAITDLPSYLQKIQISKQPLHLYADKTVVYQKIAEILSLIQQANIENISFVTEPI